MNQHLNLLLIVSSLALLPISVMAEDTNALATLHLSFQKQEQALLDDYGKALGSLMAESKKKGDLDLYLVVETERKRFETEKYVPSLSDANAAFKSAAGNYYKARTGILKKYVSALDGLVKTEVQADRMESAKAVKAEKDKVAFELADLESKMPRPVARKVAISTPSVGKGGKTKTLDLGKGVKMELVLIPSGSFMMGSEDVGSSATPVHKVTITKSFYMGKYEVTQEQWEQVIGSNPSGFKGADNPVEQVSWNDCQGFVAKLAEKMRGTDVRLPTEAEWEYACRAESETAFCFGDDEGKLGQYAWFLGNSGSKTHLVGEKKPNAWGLFDMHGNVLEWCSDGHGSYEDKPTTNPVGSSSGSGRVSRGGAWENDAGNCRSAFRCSFGPGASGYNVGLRVVVVVR